MKLKKKCQGTGRGSGFIDIKTNVILLFRGILFGYYGILQYFDV